MVLAAVVFSVGDEVVGPEDRKKIVGLLMTHNTQCTVYWHCTIIIQKILNITSGLTYASGVSAVNLTLKTGIVTVDCVV